MAKSFKTFAESLPKQAIAIADGKFTIPTAMQERLFDLVSYEAKERNADHAILLDNDQAVKINEILFPKINFVRTDEDNTFLTDCAEKYDTFYVFTPNDQADTPKIKFIKLDESYFTTDHLTEIALSGDVDAFRAEMCSGAREVDVMVLMNEIRFNNGVLPVKEATEDDVIRNAYLNNEILQIDETVELGGTVYDIINRYSNHLVLKNGSKTTTRFMKDVVGDIYNVWKNEKMNDVPETVTDKFVKGLIDRDYKEIDKENFENTFNPDDPKKVAELYPGMIKGNEAMFAKMCNENRPWLLDVIKKKKGMKIEALNDIDVEKAEDIEKLMQYTKLQGAFPTIDDILVSSVLNIASPSTTFNIGESAVDESEVEENDFVKHGTSVGLGDDHDGARMQLHKGYDEKHPKNAMKSVDKHLGTKLKWKRNEMTYNKGVNVDYHASHKGYDYHVQHSEHPGAKGVPHSQRIGNESQTMLKRFKKS